MQIIPRPSQILDGWARIRMGGNMGKHISPSIFSYAPWLPNIKKLNSRIHVSSAGLSKMSFNTELVWFKDDLAGKPPWFRKPLHDRQGQWMNIVSYFWCSNWFTYRKMVFCYFFIFFLHLIASLQQPIWFYLHQTRDPRSVPGQCPEAPIPMQVRSLQSARPGQDPKT